MKRKSNEETVNPLTVSIGKSHVTARLAGDFHLANRTVIKRTEGKR
jgi:hypothetical protein